MRTTMVCLLLAALVAGALPAAQAQEGAPARKPKPKAKAKATKAEEKIEFTRDGGIERGGRITRYWQVNHEDPVMLKTELERYVKGPDVGLDPRGTNVIRIEATPEKWEIIEKLLEIIDVPQPQVYVEAKIIEIKYDSNLEFGFEGTYDRRKATDAAQPFFGKFTGTFNPETFLDSIGTSKPFQGGTFDFATVGSRNIEKHGVYSYIVRALQERGSAEILSQPSIIAVQGKMATITTGLRFPIQSVDVRGNQTIVTTKFETTGIKLELTPTRVGREFVTLDIKAEDSQVTERIPGPEGSLNPVISERTAQTQVTVRDGETIIIGGLLSSSTIESKVGLPLISDIPLVGLLFSSTRTQEVKGELVFFIKPRIIKRKEHTVILPPGERKRMNQ